MIASLLALVFLLLPLGPASATLDDCRSAATRAAERHRIPKDVLIAMVEVESGSWPFAIGVNATATHPDPLARHYSGRSYRAGDAATAAAWVRGLRSIGLTSLDVGCLQVNLHHHRSAFATIEEAFDPDANADYAARHLAGLKAAHGTWETAVARYHASSRKPQVAYLCRVRARLAARGWAVSEDPRCGRPGPGPRERGSSVSTRLAERPQAAGAIAERREREARSHATYLKPATSLRSPGQDGSGQIPTRP